MILAGFPLGGPTKYLELSRVARAVSLVMVAFHLQDTSNIPQVRDLSTRLRKIFSVIEEKLASHIFVVMQAAVIYIFFRRRQLLI